MKHFCHSLLEIVKKKKAGWYHTQAHTHIYTQKHTKKPIQFILGKEIKKKRDETSYSLVTDFGKNKPNMKPFKWRVVFRINKAKHCPHTMNRWSTAITENILTENIHRPFQEL